MFTRGGVSYISNRNSKANNNYLKSYYLQQESKYAIYLDVNSLYRYAMSRLLPISVFKEIGAKEFDLNKNY